MCIYTVKKQNLKNKNKFSRGGGCATPPNVPKLGAAAKDTATTNKY